MYDVEEYLHLALHASANRNPHASLGYLREALALEPENSKAVYLLAIQHAEIGLIARAIAGLTKALALDPTFEIARMQLGLLMIERGQTVEARAQFLQSQKSSDQALRTFAEAMVRTLDGRVASAIESMRAAIGMQTTNVALRQLMQEVLARLEKIEVAGAAPREQSEPAGENRLHLGAYAGTAGRGSPYR